jgi:hypothetical protein
VKVKISDKTDEIEKLGLVLRPVVFFPYMAGLARFDELEKAELVPLLQLPPDWPSDAEEEELTADGAGEDDYESDVVNDEAISEDDLSLEDKLVPQPVSPNSDVSSLIYIDSSKESEVRTANLLSLVPSEDETHAVPKTIVSEIAESFLTPMMKRAQGKGQKSQSRVKRSEGV